MSDYTYFVNNYSDLSTDTGYQFEFTCSKCSSGYRSKFRASAAGTASSVLNMANSVLGGIFNSASNVTDQVKSAGWQKGWEKAFKESQDEVLGNFIQCPRCNAWVCRSKCWNNFKGLCKGCAPDLGVEMAAAQANKSVEEVWAHAKMAEEDKKLGEAEWREGVVASCPKCEQALPNKVKYCPNCGFEVNAKLECKKCKSKLKAGAKFCAECGEKV